MASNRTATIKSSRFRRRPRSGKRSARPSRTSSGKNSSTCSSTRPAATRLFATADGVAFADLIVAGHRETWPIRSKQFRYEYIRYLKRQLERLTEAGAILALTVGLSLRKSAVNAAIDEFEMRAICSRATREVHVRVAAEGDDIYIDLADADWHAVRVTAMGWSIVQSPPVRFRRSAGMQPLPFPERGVAIDRLRPFLNVNASDFTLVVAYLLAALRPDGPYPVLALIGEQGTAKTTFMRLLRSLVDPSTVPSSALPFSGRDLFIAAHNAHVQAFENVSKLSNPMSDYLCRLATGGGVRTRALFRDVDETLLRATRPIMLEGIANYITRADLMDRAIILAPRTVSRPQDRSAPAGGVREAATGPVRRAARPPRHRHPATARHPSHQSAAHGGFRDLGRGLRARRLRASLSQPIVRPRSMSRWSMTCSPARCGR